MAEELARTQEENSIDLDPRLNIGSSGQTQSSEGNSSAAGDEQEQNLKKTRWTQRQRLRWKGELEERFKRVCEYLGEKATPKKIMSLMNVQGLTRENVASRLQNHKAFLRKNKGSTSGTGDESDPTTEATNPPQFHPMQLTASNYAFVCM